MSIPHPDTSVLMYQDMLKRKYNFFIGDTVEIYSKFGNGYQGVRAKIMYPYYYDWEGNQTYITELTPIPYMESELKLVDKNPSGEKDTYDFFKYWLEKVDSKEYRDSWVSP